MVLLLPIALGALGLFAVPLYLLLVAANGFPAVIMAVVEVQGAREVRIRRQLVFDELKRRDAETPQVS